MIAVLSSDKPKRGFKELYDKKNYKSSISLFESDNMPEYEIKFHYKSAYYGDRDFSGNTTDPKIAATIFNALVLDRDTNQEPHIAFKKKELYEFQPVIGKKMLFSCKKTDPELKNDKVISNLNLYRDGKEVDIEEIYKDY